MQWRLSLRDLLTLECLTAHLDHSCHTLRMDLRLISFMAVSSILKPYPDPSISSVAYFTKELLFHLN
jgi:hypothetical protein